MGILSKFRLLFLMTEIVPIGIGSWAGVGSSPNLSMVSFLRSDPPTPHHP